MQMQMQTCLLNLQKKYVTIEILKCHMLTCGGITLMFSCGEGNIANGLISSSDGFSGGVSSAETLSCRTPD